jgi:uncharacterized metal-binding protein YceD (DUF177 family)
MSEFALQVVDIDETGRDYSFELKKPWLESSLADANLHADPEAPAGTLKVHAQKNGAEYLVEGHVQVSLTTECGRCLGVARVPVDTRFATLFTRSAHTTGGHHKDGAHASNTSDIDDEVDGDEDELAREEFSGHEIVLDGLIREYLVLECPMQPLCSEDCTGIAVPKHVQPPEDVFGRDAADSKVDPRLAPLLRLRDKVPPKRDNKE